MIQLLLLKTDATTPGDEDTFTSYLAGTLPDFGSSRVGPGTGSTTTGFYTGATAKNPYRGYSGFTIPILFNVKDPYPNLNKIYGGIQNGS